jgi:hypothetical protein
MPKANKSDATQAARSLALRSFAPASRARSRTTGPERLSRFRNCATLAIPIHPELRAILDTVPAGQLTFITTLRGKPFPPHASRLGLPPPATRPDCRAPARSTACAISGHVSLKEIERYTKAADQARLRKSSSFGLSATGQRAFLFAPATRNRQRCF